MDTKENLNTSFPTGAIVKPEPREIGVPPYGAPSDFQRGSSGNVVKSEPNDLARAYLDRGLSVPAYIQNGMPSDLPQAKPEEDKLEPLAGDQLPVPAPQPRLFFTLYESADDIRHTPEQALKQGLGMVKSIEENLTKLDVGRQLRKDVWKRDIETLNNQGAPRTLIAVCGATGAGKSSILNAVLDDNIVPTSGMRACTAVVTEISYHERTTVDADISFLSEAEWKEELGVLLHDLADEEGNVKRITDLKSDAGVAWQKVHAVYPKITQDELVKMNVAQIISYDMNISRILGATKTITAKDSKAFAKEIAQYIDSKDQKRGKKDKDGKKDKGKQKEKPKEKSVMDMVRNAAGMTSRTVNGGGGEGSKSSKEKDLDAPALWPLIRQVNVRCNAHALSTGAVLVDLPGVADANAARNNIAKDYMKKCNCIWILAPITRAVDDKTARDLLGDAFKMQLMNGNYDDHAITFIASKCDDISCSEVVRALRLEDHPVMEDIEDRLSILRNDSSEVKKLKSAAEKEVKIIQDELQEIRDFKKEYEDHLAALKAGEFFTPKLTKKKEVSAVGKKRKNKRGGKKGSPKRKRSVADDEDDEDDFDDDVSDSGSSSDSESDNDSDDYQSAASEHEDEEVEEVTEETLEEKIKQSKEKIKVARERLNEVRARKKEAGDAHSTLEKAITKVQREKNAFCSLKRSEFSKDVLKEDFRTGLKDLDDSAAEERDPDNFDPTQNIRNYDAINLPVFTCSSRDYVRLKGQVKGDGEAACFSNVDDTGIPVLQKWCHTLTVASRERAARSFLTHLKTFAASIQAYVTGIGDVTAHDREALRELWESRNHLEPIDDAPQIDDDPLRAILGGLGGGLGMGLYTMQEPQGPKVDVYGQLTGIAPRLCKEFAQLVDTCVEDLQNSFKDGLEEKCRVGASNASDAAAATVVEIEQSMHWATYRATLRRHGAWRRDMNVELINPFTRSIAHSWSKVFESDLFKPFENDTIDAINNLVKEVTDSAAPGLKDKARIQGEVCVEEAKIALTNSVELVKETMNREQKEISRCLAPHVQNELTPGYDTAMEERGTGSVARQKAYFRGFVDQNRDTVFDGGADNIMDRLTAVSDALGEALCESMGKLAEKIEVSLAVLWEGSRDSPQQAKARAEIIDLVTSIQQQIQFWTEADKLKQAEKEFTNAMDED